MAALPPAVDERSFCPTSLLALGGVSIVDLGRSNRCIVDDALFLSLEEAKHVSFQGFTVAVPFAWNVLPSDLCVTAFSYPREAFVITVYVQYPSLSLLYYPILFSSF